MRNIAILIGLTFCFQISPVIAVQTVSVGQQEMVSHSGRTASDGCHYDRQTGIRHCH